MQMDMGCQLSWLEHTLDKRGVTGSSPVRSTKLPQQLSRLEHLTVNQGVLGSSPSWGAIFYGQLVKWLNTLPFHGSIHGFEFRTGHHFRSNSVSEFFLFIRKVRFIINKKMQYYSNITLQINLRIFRVFDWKR